ncbi:N-terminal C2 in EEIG1 and EHBP1 proteins-domain-containing protein [Chytridium lagenaria]|nr:N-terminal C2 in EEIG1 and EHBP1 proteins-domain-containing protein [Chytridium lagenaria]
MFRKKVFAAECNIVDLVNLPYVSGFYFVRWKLKGSNTKGVSARATVKDHTVTWNTSFAFEASIYIGKDGVLLPCELLLYIKQEVNGGRSSEDLGMISINLAEYADSRSSVQKHLLQDARVNSVVRVKIDMKLLKGAPVFAVPNTEKRDMSIDRIRNFIAGTSHPVTDSISAYPI